MSPASPLRDAVILYNPHAGRRRHLRLRHLEEARRILKDAGIDAELQPTAGPDSAARQARAAVEQGRQLVIVSGGDGTVNEAINGLAGSQVPLALLPSGTANVLGKELALPWDIPSAARLIPQAALRRIALGLASRCDGGAQRYFASVAGAGIDAQMVHDVNETLKRHTGQLAYCVAGVQQVFRYRFPPFRAVSTERQLEGTTIFVGRTKHYGGPMRITTEANLFEDAFEVGVVTARRIWRSLIHAPAAMFGRMHGIRDVHFWKTNRVRCEPLSELPIYAQVDGELFGQLPMEFRIVPDALTLVVPRSPGENGHG